MNFTAGVTILAPDAISLAGTVATSTGALTIGDGTSPITLDGSTTLTAANNNNITIGGTVNGNQTLILNSGGITSIDGVIGGTTPINTLTTDAAGTTRINANISSSSNQRYNDTVDIEGATRTLTSTGGSIFFDGTVDSLSTTRRSLTVNAGSGLTTFDAAVGGTNAMGAIIISGSGGLDLDAVITNATSLAVTGATNLGASVTTVDTQTYTGATTVSVDTTLTTTNSNVTFTGALDADATERDLTINTGGTTGTILMSSVVGQTNEFDVIAITGNLDLDANIGADNFGTKGATSISVSEHLT